MRMRGTERDRQHRERDRQQDRGQRRAPGEAQRATAVYEPVEEAESYPPYPGGYPGQYGQYEPYTGQYPGQHPGTTGQRTGYHTAARQPLAQARAQMATRYAEAVQQDPAHSGTYAGSRANRTHRAWQDGELSGASDVSLPRIRIAEEPSDFTGQSRAPRQAPRRAPLHPGAGATRVVDAWPDAYPAYPAYPGELPQDPYQASQTSAEHWGTAAHARRRVTAQPLTGEQRTVVIEHPYEAQFDGGETLDESGVPEFTREIDALISSTSAKQRVVLPKSKPAGGKRAVRRFGIVAALGVRVGVAFLILVGIMSGITALTGHPPIPNLPLPIFGSTDAGAMAQFGVDANLLGRIQPLTQLKRSDQYDSAGQWKAWGGSACSAAVLAETLTAYGVQGATIGHMIDELGGNISQQWGLVSYNGFSDVAAKHGLRADIYVDHPLTYAQMLYLTNTLHVPLIVNVRATGGYYHYLSGGHFLVMTGGDAQTVRLVDSSEYYIKSLSYATFMGMYRNRSVAIVPKDFQYTLP